MTKEKSWRFCSGCPASRGTGSVLFLHRTQAVKKSQYLSSFEPRPAALISPSRGISSSVKNPLKNPKQVVTVHWDTSAFEHDVEINVSQPCCLHATIRGPIPCLPLIEESPTGCLADTVTFNKCTAQSLKNSQCHDNTDVRSSKFKWQMTRQEERSQRVAAFETTASCRSLDQLLKINASVQMQEWRWTTFPSDLIEQERFPR